MGKKVKKKARSGQKEKQAVPHSPKIFSQQCGSNAETPGDDGVLVAKERGLCSHMDRGINLEKLSAKLESLEPHKCEDCRGSAIDRRANRGKGKHRKKGGVSSKSELKAIWICLECGHFSCGGVGFPTTPQSHAVRHAKQNHHSLAIQFENSQLLWCFPCNNLVNAKKHEDNGEYKDAIHEIVKMLKVRPSEGSSVNVENVWFGSGSETSAIISDNPASIRADERASYSVRGLINLGNTCFFNSIMQNLLVLNKFRDSLFKLDESVGPLSASLRKLFLETDSEAGSKSAISPRSLFGSLCSKAPQFRGYQQHDSHELLRCLLDTLSAEELIARKKVKSSLADGTASVGDPTSVDAIFGGQLSSNVRCMECGHTSAIYEPFLDLSLPIPSKKPPPKRAQPVIRGKKQKVPPKRNGKIRSNVSRDPHLPAECVSDQSTVANSFSEVQSRLQSTEQLVISSGDLAPSSFINLNAAVVDMGFTPQDLSGIQQPKNHQVADNAGEQSVSSDILTWLDYLESNQVSSTIDSVSENHEISENQVSLNENAFQNDTSFPSNMDSNIGSSFACSVPETSLDNARQLNSIEQGILAHQSDAVSQFEDKKTAISQFDEKFTKEESLTEELVQHNSNLVYSSESSYRGFSNNSNLDVCSSERDAEKHSQVHPSEVLSLPYTKDVSSSFEPLVSSVVVGDEPDYMEFDGFGDLFNEPEDSSELGPSDHVSEASGTVKNEAVGNSSDSDPSEVDNSNSPVSVESCLAFFTKPELLSKDEHAWQCDNCSKVLCEQLITSRKLKRPIKEMAPNGCDNENRNCLLDDGKILSETKIINGTVGKDVFDASSGGSMTHNSEIHDNGDSILRNHQETEMNVVSCQPENIMPVMISEEQEVDSKSFKVSRDATKNVFINKAPSILTIHLKRFSQDARGRLSKLNGHVNFREIIDLKPYMNPRCIDKGNYTYRLVGAIEHLGSMRGGHYVAYVRGGAERYGDSIWYHASDAHVREASLEEVLRCEAYILFYEGT